MSSQLAVINCLRTVQRLGDWRHRILQSCCTVEQHYRLVRGYASAAQLLLVSGQCGCTFGAQQDSLLGRCLLLSRQNLVVVDGCSKAFAFTQSAQDQKVADGCRNTDSGSDRVSVLPKSCMLLTFVICADDRSTASRRCILSQYKARKDSGFTIIQRFRYINPL